jgi:ADP-ribose pyrophosphatase
MSKIELKLSSETRVFDEYFKIDAVEVAEFKNGIFQDSYNRFKLTRADAVTVLLFNQDTNCFTLVKQFRFPIAHHEKENILEAIAGKIDAGETPQQAAVREVYEEVGYKITEQHLGKPIEFYASPGYSTEKIYVFLAVVKNSDKDQNAGGGVQGEHENIEIVEVTFSDFLSKIDTNEIKDSKTIIASRLIRK